MNKVLTERCLPSLCDKITIAFISPFCSFILKLGNNECVLLL